MTVLVTGGAGFIGSHLAECLVAGGQRVVVLDNMSKGRRENLRSIEGSEWLAVEEGDLRDEETVRRVSAHGPYDVVYHLAAMHFIPECVARPSETLSVNVVGTETLLSGLECRRFIFASTGDIYAPKAGPHQETDSAEPFNIYGLSKLFGERLLEIRSRTDRTVEFVAARLFNVYGPRETNPHIIPRILEGIKRGDMLRLGNLSPRRDYTHVADTVAALAALKRGEQATSFEAFNVGTGATTSVEELVVLFGEILGTTLNVRVDPHLARSGDRPHLQADSSKLRKLTGWQPRKSLREGLTHLCQLEGLIP